MSKILLFFFCLEEEFSLICDRIHIWSSFFTYALHFWSKSRRFFAKKIKFHVKIFKIPITIIFSIFRSSKGDSNPLDLPFKYTTASYNWSAVMPKTYLILLISIFRKSFRSGTPNLKKCYYVLFNFDTTAEKSVFMLKNIK